MLCLAPSDTHRFASVKPLVLITISLSYCIVDGLTQLQERLFTEFGGMCVGTIGFQSSGSSPMFGLRRYSAVKSMIG